MLQMLLFTDLYNTFKETLPTTKATELSLQKHPSY